LDFLASFLGFLSSVILSFPAWRASILLKDAYSVQRTSKGTKNSTKSAGEALEKAIENRANAWSPAAHYSLIVGLICMLLSGLLGLWISFPKLLELFA